MGDTGFQDEHIAVWQHAENQFDIKNAPPKLPKKLEHVIGPSDFDNKFKPEKKSKGKFLGSKQGFAYKRRRWHRLLPRRPSLAGPANCSHHHFRLH